VQNHWEDADMHAEVLFDVHQNSPEFPTLLNFYNFPHIEDLRVHAALTRRLAQHFGCSALCEGTRWGRFPSPYWSALFERGCWFLVNDAESSVFGEDGVLKLDSELNLPAFSLDSAGNLMNAATTDSQE
jgi:hypothetical protein